MISIQDLLRSATGGYQIPGCDHAHGGPMFLRSRCHTKTGTFVSVDPVRKTLRVECTICKKEIVTIGLEL